MAGFWANYLRSNPLRLAVKRWAPSLFKVSREIEVSLGAAGIDEGLGWGIRRSWS